MTRPYRDHGTGEAMGVFVVVFVGVLAVFIAVLAVLDWLDWLPA